MATVQNAELRAILRLQDEFSGKLNSIAGSAGSAFATVGKAAAGAGLIVGGALVGGLALSVKAAGDLEQAVANISTIKPEIDTSAVFAQLNELSTKVPQSASQLGDALYDVFSSVSVSQAEGLALTEKFAKSAVGAQTDAKTFGTAAMGVMNAYGLAVADADHISDVFFNTIAAGVVTGEELARGLGPITGSAKAAGVSLDVMGGLMVGVTKQGGDAAQNLNNLNNLLQKITTTDAVKAMKALGVSTTDASGKFREMPDVLGDLKTSLAGMTEAGRANALQSIFPDAQARAGAQTIMDQLDAVNAAIETNKTQSGSAASAYEKMSATFNSQSKILMNTLTSIATTVGAEVLPKITPLVKQFSEALPGAMKTAGDFMSGTLVPAVNGALDTVARFLGLEPADYAAGWDLAGGIISRAVDLATEAFNSVIAVAGPPLQAVLTWLTSTGWPGLVAASTAASSWWTTTGQPAFTALATFLGTNLPPVLTWISETGWPALVTAGEAVGAKVNEMTAFFGALFVEMDKRGVFTDLNQIWTDLSAIAGALGEMIGGLAQPMRDADEEAARMNVTTDFTAQSFKNAIGPVRDFVAMVRSIVDAANAAGKFLDDLQKKVIGAGLAINKFMREHGIPMGNGFVTGVAAGINQGVPGLEAAASNAADVVPGAFQDSWDMRSPSKVAMAQGFQYASGLAAGIAHGDNAVHEAVLAIVKNAMLNNIDPLIALALAKAESNFKSGAVGDSGASVGLFQLHERGQGAGMGASRADPWVNASKFLGAHKALYDQLVAEGLAGEQLAVTFGRLAEGSDPQFANRYGDAYRELALQLVGTSWHAEGLTGTIADLGRIQQQSNVWAETMAAQQMKLSEVLSGHVDPDLIHMTDAMKNFGAVLGPIERQVAGGSISMETLRFKLVDLARATGLATTPWDDYNAGLIDMDEAMMRVVTDSASAGPQFEALRQQLGTTNTITNEGTLQWLQLALAMGKVVPAAATVNTAQVGLAATAGAQIAPATTLVNNLAGSFDSAKLSIDGAKDSLRDYTNYLFELVPTRQQEQVKAWESVRDAVSGAADAVSSYRSILESLTSAAKDAASAGVALPEFATGGVVGGPIGSPRLAIVHGGEAILTPSQQRRGMGGGGVYIENLNVTQLPGEDGRAFAGRVADVLAARTAEARRRG